MEVFLSTLKAIIDNLGATVALPIIIFLFAVALGAQPGRAFRAGVTIGIAFIGINLVIGLMWTNLSEVAQAMVKNTGIQRDVVDVGWPSAAAIAFGSAVGLWVIPLTLVINILMLTARLTKTLNIDIWNYWHFAFIGSLTVAATGNLLLGLLAAAIAAALALFFADWTAPAVQRFYGLPGISIPHLTTAPGVPIAIVVNWIIDRIPGLRDVQADPEAIRRRLGIAGEPVILGLIIGLVLGTCSAETRFQGIARPWPERLREVRDPNGLQCRDPFSGDCEGVLAFPIRNPLQVTLAVPRPVFRGLRGLQGFNRISIFPRGLLAVPRPVFRGLRDSLSAAMIARAAATSPCSAETRFQGIARISELMAVSRVGSFTCSAETRFQGIATLRPQQGPIPPGPRPCSAETRFQGIATARAGPVPAPRARKFKLAVPRSVFGGLQLLELVLRPLDR